QPEQETQRWIPTQILPSGPDFDYASILRVTVEAIQRARHRVYLTTPYFVPDATSAQALTSASLRGIDVRILLPRRTDNYVVTKAAQSWFDDLVASGIRVFEYGPRMLHTKSMIVDDDISFIGSANFDNRSFYLNFEVSVLCYEREANQALLEEFNASMKYAQEVQLTHQPFFSRLSKAVARLFSPLL
ncbi:MAG: phospholipase D-like domain-containing protein, partial [Advenella sp.]